MQKMKSEVNSNSSRSRLHSSQRGALLGPSYEGPKRGGGRYAKMEQEMQRSNQDFIRGELQDQQVGGACRRGVCGWWVGPVCVVYHFCVDGSEDTLTVVTGGIFCAAQLSQKSILYNLCVCVCCFCHYLSPCLPPCSKSCGSRTRTLRRSTTVCILLVRWGRRLAANWTTRTGWHTMQLPAVGHSFLSRDTSSNVTMHGAMSTCCGNIVRLYSSAVCVSVCVGVVFVV